MGDVHARAPNAYWDVEYREVVLCFKFMTAFLTIADRPRVAAAIKRFHTRDLAPAFPQARSNQRKSSHRPLICSGASPKRSILPPRA